MLSRTFVRRSRPAGFTLLELIIVMVVLAALAAMVIPTLGYVKGQADSATTAATAQEILNNFEIYKASTGQYPDRLDSLVDESGAFYGQIYDAGSGSFPYGTVEAGGGSGFAYYFMTNGGGVSQVGVHDSSNTDDPNRATTPAALGPSQNLCVMAAGYTPASSFSTKEQAIINTCFPNQTDPTNPQVPADHTLVFLGVGPTNSAVGSTMTEAPLAPEKTGSDEANYDRYIAVFDVQPGGSTNRGQVQLKCVLDPEFNVVARNLQFFEQASPQDDFGT